MIFDADLSKVDDGVELPYDGSVFTIAHLSNMKFQRALARLQQPYRRQLAENKLDPEINQDLVCKAFAEGIVLGWSRVTNKKGEEVPFSKANALALLKRDPAFRDWVTAVATDMSNFREEEVEELGNV